jgi:hypothetical protein
MFFLKKRDICGFAPETAQREPAKNPALSFGRHEGKLKMER